MRAKLQFSRKIQNFTRNVHVMPFLPKAFKEERIPILHQLIKDYPLGTIILQNQVLEYIPGTVRFHVRPDQLAGKLYGQIHLTNAMHYLFEKHDRKGKRSIVTFSSPTGWISPAWYAEDKDLKYPNYNYAKVYCTGHPKIIKDPEVIAPFVEEIQDPEWNRSMMNKKRFQYMMEKQIWFEIGIDSIVGDFRMSQDQSVRNIQSIMENLETKDPTMHALMTKYYQGFSDSEKISKEVSRNEHAEIQEEFDTRM